MSQRGKKKEKIISPTASKKALQAKGEIERVRGEKRQALDRDR